MQFKGFSKKGIKFLKDLSKNNTKIWFEDHRDIYDSEIKNITEDYVQDMGETLQILVPSINLKAKVSKSLFKIYRDVRFSKDKIPMKSKIFEIGSIPETNFPVIINKELALTHHTAVLGVTGTGKSVFSRNLIREYLKDDIKREELHNIIEDLKSQNYLFPEAKFSRLPRGIDKEDTHLYLYFYGAIFAYQTFKIDKTFYSEEILQRVFKIYDDMRHLQKWVYEMTLTHTQED